MVGSEPVICPSLIDYSPVEQRRAAQEVEQMPGHWITPRLLGDYAATREEIRACRDG